MKYLLDFNGNKHKLDGTKYEYLYIEKDVYEYFDIIEHTFSYQDYLVSFLKGCNEKNALDNLKVVNSNYIVLINYDRKCIPIKSVLES